MFNFRFENNLSKPLFYQEASKKLSNAWKFRMKGRFKISKAIIWKILPVTISKVLPKHCERSIQKNILKFSAIDSRLRHKQENVIRSRYYGNLFYVCTSMNSII